jgi:uncharacterized protein (DUF305 family)
VKKHIKNTSAILAILATGAFTNIELAYTQQNTMIGLDLPTATPVDSPDATTGYKLAMAVMMSDMMFPLSGKTDLDFVNGMIPHHQGAVDMAKVVIQFGKDPAVKTLAAGIIKTQKIEIAKMQGWLKKADQNSLTISGDAVRANGQAMALMMKNMMVPYTGDADIDFIKGMIPHHQGAVDMANVALNFSHDPALLKLADEIVKAQEGEISFMKNWLSNRTQQSPS